MFCRFHWLNRGRCVQNAQWVDDRLRCPACGKELAYKYKLDNTYGIFIHTEYKPFKVEIMSKYGK